MRHLMWLTTCLLLSGCITNPGALQGPWYEEGPADFGFTDQGDDVTVGGSPDSYNGPGASALDLLAVHVVSMGNYEAIRLEIQDLDAHENVAKEAGYHAQYAVSFLVNGQGPGFSARATFDGDDRGKGWRFSLHDQHADEWPDIPGRTEQDASHAIQWQIPHHLIDASAGDQLTDWNVSSWASFDDPEQFGDSATTTKVHTIRSGS